jgi:hypothetical protein
MFMFLSYLYCYIADIVYIFVVLKMPVFTVARVSKLNIDKVTV